MKKLFTLFVIIALTISVFAQVPEKMSYQAVVRNASGELVQNSPIGIRISILQYFESGPAVYTETHTTSSNVNGLISIEIGSGTWVNGNFSTIDWTQGNYYIKIETDVAGGTNYTISGTSQILSVPYALHAMNADTADTYLESDPVFTLHPAFGISSGNITNWSTAYSWGNHSGLYRPITYVPAWGEITSKPNTVSGFGITDGVTTTGNQTIAGNKTFSGTTTVITPVNATDAATKAYVDAVMGKVLQIQADLGATDVDGNTYKAVKIGNQVWMSENLKTTRYRNGDLIGTTTPATLDISGETTPKYQWAYDGNESNVATYGRLYTWYAITDSRNVCPIGWHVPTINEWSTLTTYLTNNSYGYEGSGSDIAKSMAATSGWTTSTTAGTIGNDQASNNSSGFTARAGGMRYNGQAGIYWFVALGDRGRWWTTSVGIESFELIYSYANASNGSYNDYIHDGCSVRCLKDN